MENLNALSRECPMTADEDQCYSCLGNTPVTKKVPWKREARQGYSVDKLLSLQEYENNDELSNLFLAPQLQAQWQQPLAAQGNGFSSSHGTNVSASRNSMQAQVEEVGSCHMNSVEETRRTEEEDAVESAPLQSIKADHICSHPLFMRFLTGHIECAKIGVYDQKAVGQLDQLMGQYRVLSTRSIPIGSRPDLDQFMVAYCSMLDSYREEVNNMFKGTRDFLKALEKSAEGTRIGGLEGVKTNNSLHSPYNTFGMEAKLQATMHAMMEEEMPPSPLTYSIQMSRNISQVTKELREAIIAQKSKKYSRLPGDATKILQHWWDKNHEINPYPSKNDKLDFVRWTGLEPKQVENWFSNQRKKSCN